MIITRTPFRMSFVGGGTDLASFYKKSFGAVVSTSINKYMYITVHSNFDGGIRLSYRQTEEARAVEDIRHPLVRETMLELGAAGGIEISSMADIPGQGSGLGSSSSYTVGLLNALHAFAGGRGKSPSELAELACKIEITRCKEPVGKQDQYAAAHGGLRLYRFLEDGSVTSAAILAQPNFLQEIESSVLFFYTGISRSASSVLHQQKENVESNKTFYVLEEMRDLALDFANALENSDLGEVAGILNKNWELKKKLANNVSTREIDNWFDKGMEAGALCGKLLGAGSGGFLMFLAAPDKREAVKRALSGLKFVSVDFENSGSQIIFNDEVRKDD